MRLVLLMLLALTPQILLAAPSPPADGEAMSRYSITKELERTPVTSTPSIRACSYNPQNSRIVNITRMEMHSKSCETERQYEQSIDNQLPDRPEEDIYRVGEPFDTPKRN